MPLNAVPSSFTVMRRLFLFTDSVVVLRSPSSLVVSIGVSVMAVGMSEPFSRYGFCLVCGCRSTNCSPTADLFATTALVFLGMSL